MCCRWGGDIDGGGGVDVDVGGGGDDDGGVGSVGGDVDGGVDCGGDVDGGADGGGDVDVGGGGVSSPPPLGQCLPLLISSQASYCLILSTTLPCGCSCSYL